MSRLLGRPVAVVTEARSGSPALVGGSAVIHVYSRHREWIGALEGRGEVDVWQVEIAQGLVELHHDRALKTWTVAREAD